MASGCVHAGTPDDWSVSMADTLVYRRQSRVLHESRSIRGIAAALRNAAMIQTKQNTHGNGSGCQVHSPFRVCFSVDVDITQRRLILLLCHSLIFGLGATGCASARVDFAVLQSTGRASGTLLLGFDRAAISWAAGRPQLRPELCSRGRSSMPGDRLRLAHRRPERLPGLPRHVAGR